MKKTIIILTIILVISLLMTIEFGCAAPAPSLTPTPESTPTPEPTPAPVPTPRPAPLPSPTPTPISVAEKLKVHFIDVDQGDSILIDSGEIEILIDAGDKSPGVVSYLNNYVEGALEVMVATHTHPDHIGGLIEVLNTYEVEEIWHNDDESDSDTYRDFKAAMLAEDAEKVVARLYKSIHAGPISLFVHHPTDTSRTTNNNSIVLHLAYGDIDFLFTGDAESEAEAAMMALSSVRVPEVEIIKIGHHGSQTASSEDFIAITSPEVAIYMAGEGNRYEHPDEETIETFNNIAATIYGTDVNGTIVVTTDGETYTIELEKQNGSSATPEPTQPAPSEVIDVKITKIFFNGLVPQVESDEYVEITNLGNETVDLAGWVLVDITSGSSSLTFPSYILQPGTSIRVYTNEVHFEYGGFSFESGTAIWNNSAPDAAVLYNAQGVEISRKSY